MDIALRTRTVHHYYHNTTGTHGHLSTGAIVAIIVVALLALGIWAAVKYSQNS